MTSTFQSMTLAHLNLDVADLERSEAFYRDVLGLPVTRGGESLSIRWPGGLLVLVAGSPNPAGTFHFGFRVATDAAVDACFAQFEARDATIVEMPVARGAVYVGRIRDPDGYPIEIYAQREDG